MQAIFFLRNYADIDHIAPVIYYWSHTKSQPTWIVLYGSKTMLNDFRINFLAQSSNVKVIHIADLAKDIIGRELIPHEQNWMAQPGGIATLPEWIDAIFQYTEAYTQKSVIIFDWIYDQYQELVAKKAQSLNIKMIALPHGLSTFPSYNRMHALDSINPINIDRSCHSKNAHEIFDYLVFPSKDFLDLCQSNFPKERIKILGSARYDILWQNICHKITPKLEVSTNPSLKKVVLFLRSNCYPIFWDEVVRTIKMLLCYPNICLLVQHHPRENDCLGDLNSVYNFLNNIDPTRYRVVTNDEVSSTSLVDWADLVLDLGTGMGFHAVMHNKPLVEVEYLFAYSSTISKELPLVRADCRDELCSKIDLLCNNKLLPYYNSEERDAFIAEYFGDYINGTLKNYYNLILSCLIS